MSEMTIRNKKMMLAGLFLSKFNEDGYEALGYKNFNEAYHSLAAIVGGPWRSVKQYRDEFDVAFDNGRKGWRNRAMHPTRKIFLDEFGKLGIDEFLGLVQTQFATDADIDLAIDRKDIWQVRYAASNPFAVKVNEVFKISGEYIKVARDLAEEGTRVFVKVPSVYKESIRFFFRTDDPRVWRAFAVRSSDNEVRNIVPNATPILI